MKDLSKDGIGQFVPCARNEAVYFKPLPTDEMKGKIEDLVQSWDEYKEYFDEFITASQYNKLIMKAPNLDQLENEFGVDICV